MRWLRGIGVLGFKVEGFRGEGCEQPAPTPLNPKPEILNPPSACVKKDFLLVEVQHFFEISFPSHLGHGFGVWGLGSSTLNP